MGIIKKKTWENHKNLNLGFRTLTLSPPSPYIFVPNLFANKLGFCRDPSLPIGANDPNSALFFGRLPKVFLLLIVCNLASKLEPAMQQRENTDTER